MKGHVTTYLRLFRAMTAGEAAIAAIEIPIIQRDYAQGRRERAVNEIRTNFLDVLMDAVDGGEPVGLDFVYGRLDNAALRPLDGQQRLTTLFLLHWYLASRAGVPTQGAPWMRFSYETRTSARRFCERLARNPFPADAHMPSAWLTDQEWYLHLWHDDPTIESMLVMLDAIHAAAATRGLDPSAAWKALCDEERPAISFHSLLLDDMESDEDLYIKMNSRGKPLTPFENFKARFEQDIEGTPLADEFAHRIDGPWTDLLWTYSGDDRVVDDEMLRYIGYLTEICELRDGRVAAGPIGPRARAVFGSANERAQEHLAFLFAAFDTWQHGDHIRETFARLFSAAPLGEHGYDPSKVLLLGSATTNLFESCCTTFELERAGGRRFSLQQSLLLYAVLLHLIHGTEDISTRLRVLRNLIAASDDEIRRDRMPILLEATAAVILDGDLSAARGFNGNQRADEERKRDFLAAHPALTDPLRRLEDQSILRGTLSVFDLQVDTFHARATAFEETLGEPQRWPLVTGALLATGEYQRDDTARRPNRWYFGTGSAAQESVWRALLTGVSRESVVNTSNVLGAFLDAVSRRTGSVEDHLRKVMVDFVAAREQQDYYDWRYYLVKYDAMRSGDTGIYFGVQNRLGYELCMLRKTQLNSWYRDPILLQVYTESQVGTKAEDPWFYGWDYEPRFLSLMTSRTGLRSIEDGFEIRTPRTAKRLERFAAVANSRDDVHEYDDGRTYLEVPQREIDGRLVDTVDRVQLAAEFVRSLVAAGL